MLPESLMLHLARTVAQLFELAGIAVIVAGTLFAFGQLAVHLRSLSRQDRTRNDLVSAFRKALGRAILVGLEFLVAGDIIRTVAVEPTMNSVLVLGLIVIIRTFLSFSLEVEINGRWPWQQAASTRSE